LSLAGRRDVVAALVAVQVMFAVHYVAAKALLASIPAPAWAALRVLAGAALFLALCVARGARRVRLRDHRDLAALALLGIVINQISFTEGLQRTTASHSALINTTIPVATLLFAMLLGRERPRPAGLAGIAVATGGVLVLLRVDDARWGAEWVAGDLLTLLNAASFSLFLVLSRDAVRRLGATTATAGFLCWGALFVALYGGRDVVRLDPAVFDARVLALAAYIVVFATVGTYLVNSWALARVESSQVALFIYLQPVLAAALAVACLGERMTGRLAASGALVFAGVLLASLPAARAHAPSARASA
jgi:drug/metabolite transporter (DMT)-like permease